MKKIIALSMLISLCILSAFAQKSTKLGLNVVDLTDSEKISKGLYYETPGEPEIIYGLYVYSVEKGSKADLAGIKPGDLIFSVKHTQYVEYDSIKKCDIYRREEWNINRSADLINVLNIINGNSERSSWEFCIRHYGENDRTVLIYF